MSQIRKNFSYVMFYQVLTVITPLVTAPYVSRILGADGIGIYSYVSSLMIYFTMFASLGVQSYGTREIARHRDDKKEYSKLFWEIELMVVATTSISLVTWFLFVLFYAEYRLYLLILSIQIAGVIFDVSWVFGGLERYGYIVRKNTVCKLLGIILLFAAVRDKSDLWLYMLIIAGSAVLGNLSMWGRLPEILTKAGRNTLNVKRHFRENLVYFIPTIATSVYTVLDKTLIGIITHNNLENGYYEQATRIIYMAKVLTFASLNSVMESRSSYLFANNAIDEIHSKTEKALNYILLIGIAIVFGIIGIAKGFVPWFFGDGYERVTYLLMMFSPITVIIGISNCAGSLYYTPAGLRRQSTKYIIIGSCVNLLLNLCLIPRWGSFGAVAASLAAEMLITALYVRFSNGFVSWRLVAEFSWKRVIAAMIMLMAVLLIGAGRNSSAIVTVIQIAVGVMIYFTVLLIMKDGLLHSFVKEVSDKIRNVNK